MMIPLFYNAAKLNMGFRGLAACVRWDPGRTPGLVIIGRSGVGKSTCAQLMLGRVKQYAPKGNAKATVCDFKNEYAYPPPVDGGTSWASIPDQPPRIGIYAGEAVQ